MSYAKTSWNALYSVVGMVIVSEEKFNFNFKLNLCKCHCRIGFSGVSCEIPCEVFRLQEKCLITCPEKTFANEE